MLENAYAAAPSAALASAYAGLAPGEGVQDRAKRLRQLAARAPDAAESRYSLAAQNAAVGAWEDAEAALAPLLADQPNARALRLQGEIARGRSGVDAAAAPWFAAAIDAPREDGFDAADLAALSMEDWAELVRVFGDRGAFGPPILQLQGPRIDIDGLAAESRREVEAAEAAEQEAERAASTPALSAVGPAQDGRGDVASPELAAEGGPGPSAAAPTDQPVVDAPVEPDGDGKGDASEAEPAAAVMARQPDDPGPAPEEADQPPAQSAAPRTLRPTP
ncbi:MAG: hypothetical protein AAGL49_07555 [Pseudomonadota bacterium]